MNRKTIFFVLCILACTTTFAQKKTWIFELDGRYDRQMAGSETLTNWDYKLNVGRHLAYNFLIGLMCTRSNNEYFVPTLVTYNLTKGPVTYQENEIYQQSGFGVGLWTRYTCNLTRRLYFYIHGSATLIDYNNKQVGNQTYFPTMPVTSPEPSQILYGCDLFELYPALGYEVYKGWGVHLYAGGINYTYNNNGFYKYDRLQFDLGKRAFIGIQKIITSHPKRTQKTQNQD